MHLVSGYRGSWTGTVLGLSLKRDAFSRFGEGGYSMAFGSVPSSQVELKPLLAAKEIYQWSSKAARFQLISD